MADTIKIRVTPIVNKINVRVKEGGIKGDSTYSIAVRNGYVGTEAQWIAEYQSVNPDTQVALDLKANLASPTFTGTVNGITKSMYGLSNADNTSDANKPVSIAQQSALDGKVDDAQVLTNVPIGALFTDTVYNDTAINAKADSKIATALLGAVNGVAELDASGFVKTAQLPSYVDDVLEFTNLASFPLTGESGKIYIALDTNKTYRWSGTVYAIISETITIGEVKTDTEIASAISLKHAQGSDIQDLSGLELLSNKKTDVETNKTSDAFYPSIKSIVDWVTNLFVKGSGTENYLPKFGVGGKVLGNSNVYESVAGKVGLGTLSPTELLELYATHVALAFTRASTSGSSRFHFKTAASYIYSMGLRTNRSDFTIYDEQLALERFTILKTNGNILIGTLTDSSSKLNVAGSIKVADDTAVASATNVGATRYRATANNSYLETCMQVGVSSYQWVVVKTNVW